jgi:arylsulfatase A-like enzyme
MKALPAMLTVLSALLGGQALSQAIPTAPGPQSGESVRPNILFILADDLGWADTTPYGHTRLYQTPNIERLAKRGMTFTRAYSASPLCSPTRSAILTGLSPARTGITTPNCHLPEVRLQAAPGKSAPPIKHAIEPAPVTRLKTDYPTLPKTLKAAGYATAHFGKWHLGPEPYSPLEHGFDVDIPHWPGPGPAGSFVAPWKFPAFKENTPGEHIEDRMAAEAVAWMEKHKDHPFFLNYWQFSVHAPFDAKKELIQKYRPLVDPADPQRSPTYAAMIESFDDAIGTLLDALDRLQLADKTIIIFTSDNGGNMYNQVDGTTPTSNAPLRGGKASMFEGGTRVPQIIAWPGLTTPGSRSDALTQSEDFSPTLLEGLALDASPGRPRDGISILPALKGGTLDREAVFQYFPHSPGVPDWLPPSVSVHRKDGWKLIRLFHAGRNGAHRHLLFNLTEDPGEKNNLAAQRPELVAELDALIESFLADTKAVVPIPNPAFDPAKYRPELEGVPTIRKPVKRRNK